MPTTDSLLQELTAEAATTRRVLERVPEAHLAWRPHAKSRTLGQLAMHIAGNPSSVMMLAMQNPATLPGFAEAEAESTAQLLAVLDASVTEASR